MDEGDQEEFAPDFYEDEGEEMKAMTVTTKESSKSKSSLSNSNRSRSSSEGRRGKLGSGSKPNSNRKKHGDGFRKDFAIKGGRGGGRVGERGEGKTPQRVRNAKYTNRNRGI